MSSISIKVLTPEEERKKLREFGVVMALAFTLLTGLTLWRGKITAGFWFSFLALVFFIPGIFAPLALRPIEKRWMQLAEKMSVVVTFVIMTLTFYLLITPMAFLARVCGKKFLALDFEPERKSYWEPVSRDAPRHYLPY